MVRQICSRRDELASHGGHFVALCKEIWKRSVGVSTNTLIRYGILILTASYVQMDEYDYENPRFRRFVSRMPSSISITVNSRDSSSDQEFPKSHYEDTKTSWGRSTFSSLYRYIPGQVLHPHAKSVGRWNRFFIFSCVFKGFFDSLFLFLLSVEWDNKCIVVDRTMTEVLILHCISRPKNQCSSICDCTSWKRKSPTVLFSNQSYKTETLCVQNTSKSALIRFNIAEPIRIHYMLIFKKSYIHIKLEQSG